MPINKENPELDDVLDSIKEVCSNLELVSERVDEILNNERITDNILDGIKRTQFVIADLTYSKPNVYFEAGYALACGKTPIFICKQNHQIEFDVKDYPVIFFNSLRKLKQQLQSRIVGLR